METNCDGKSSFNKASTIFYRVLLSQKVINKDNVLMVNTLHKKDIPEVSEPHSDWFLFMDIYGPSKV